jgi:hypothetical protein
VRAFKFLDARGRAIYSGTTWSLPSSHGPGPWMVADATIACRAGIHGCRASELAYWLGDELFEIELDGDVTESRHKVVARRGRLVRRVDGYASAVRELCSVGAWNARDLAVAALEAHGHDPLAARFRDAASLRDLEALQDDVAVAFPPADDVGLACALAADAARYAKDGESPVHTPFIGACAVAHAASRGAHDERRVFDDAFHAERASQSAWLADRLSLA